MIYRKLDANGDYVFGGNKNSYYTDIEAVSQAIATRLKLLKYEWFEALEDGLPLWQQIVAQRDKSAAEKIIRERIVGTTDVRSILSFTPAWDNDNRSLSIMATIDTVYGSTDLEVSL